jgi:hypothetical protein
MALKLWGERGSPAARAHGWARPET